MANPGQQSSVDSGGIENGPRVQPGAPYGGMDAEADGDNWWFSSALIVTESSALCSGTSPVEGVLQGGLPGGASD